MWSIKRTVLASSKEIDQNRTTCDSANLLHIGSCVVILLVYFFLFRRAPPFDFETPMTDLFTSHRSSKVEAQRRVVSRWSTLVIARNHGNACLFGVPLVISARAEALEGERVDFRGHWMQRRVVKGRPEVKDALGDFGKLGQQRTILSLFFLFACQYHARVPRYK